MLGIMRGLQIPVSVALDCKSTAAGNHRYDGLDASGLQIHFSGNPPSLMTYVFVGASVEGRFSKRWVRL